MIRENLSDGILSRCLGSGIHAERIDRIAFAIGRVLPPVENVVSAHMVQGQAIVRAGPCEVFRPFSVDEERLLLIRLAPVNIGKGCAVEYDTGPKAVERIRNRIRISDVELIHIHGHRIAAGFPQRIHEIGSEHSL
jgi:hypothetical protein